MEPTFTAAASNTVTLDLLAQIATATAALLARHCYALTKREPTKSKEAAFIRLQD
jgi:hypothetical protein